MEREENQMATTGKDAELAVRDAADVVRLVSHARHTVTFPAGERAKALGSQLVPLAVAGADAVVQCGMAVVKFPAGVGWGDLCERGSDHWKLLSSIGSDGKFNDMAAIQQAALQPAAIANLALAGAAVVVGQAYMTQINDKLASIEGEICEIRAELEAERDAKLQSTFDMLQRDNVNTLSASHTNTL